MAYTEYYVAIDMEDISDVYGGGPRWAGVPTVSEGKPIKALAAGGDGATATDNNGDSDIEDLSASGWSGSDGTVQVDDVGCYDPDGLKEFFIVTAVDLGNHKITVSPKLTAAAEKGCNIGGVWAHIQHAADTVTTTLLNAAGDPPRVNVQVGTYVEEVTWDTNVGTSVIPITFWGYTTTAGDIDPWTSEARVSLRPDPVVGTGVMYIDEPYLRLYNFDAETATAAKYGIYAHTSADRIAVVNCRGVSTNYRSCYFHDNGARMLVCRCLFEDSVQAYFWSNTGFFIGNIIRNHTDASYGLSLGANTIFMCNLVTGNTATGLYMANIPTLFKGNIFADNGSHGIDAVARVDLYRLILMNNVIAHNGGFGINSTAGANGQYFLLQDYNSFYDNTSGNIDSPQITDYSLHNITASAPFTGANKEAREVNNYELTDEMKAVGFPGVLAETDFEGFMDLGALQVEAGEGGGPRHIVI